MKSIFLIIITYISIGFTFVHANTVAMVEVVEGNAILERNQQKQELSIDTVLWNGDIITTAENTRVWLTFQDASMIKLGEKSRFILDKFVPATKEQEGFSATFSLMEGVFRFFTNTDTERDIQINVSKSITLGVRGTDLFVGATPEKDWLCLVKGIIQVQTHEKTLILDKPRQFLVVPKDQPPLEIQQVPDEKFANWIKSTELLY